MSGGARVRPGPPPDPNALRRDRDKVEWVHLPAAGRTGPAPTWPLSESSPREADLWTVEWRRPQAIMWLANGHVTEVALYVRSLVVAEQPDASVAARILVQRQMDTLGLTEAGLRACRWIIDSAPVRKSTQQAVSPQARASARDRFRVIDDAT